MQYEFALAFGEYETPYRRTSDARPYICLVQQRSIRYTEGDRKGSPLQEKNPGLRDLFPPAEA